MSIQCYFYATRNRVGFPLALTSTFQNKQDQFCNEHKNDTFAPNYLLFRIIE